MAKVICDKQGNSHLRGKPQDSYTCQEALCGELLDGDKVIDGQLSCAECAAVALTAIETSTRAERKEWRKL